MNDNPSAVQFYKNAQALRVTRACTLSVKGNCRGDKEIDETECQQLNRRKSRSRI